MVANRKWASIVALVIVFSMILAACGPTPPPEVIVETVVVEQTKIVEKEGELVTIVETQVVEKIVKETVQVEKEVEVTPEPNAMDRTGAWLDMVVVVEEPSAEAAVTRLDVGEIDVYAMAVADAEVYQTTKDNPNLTQAESVGTNDDLTFNPAGPIFEGTGKLNPFAEPKIREAMNWLIDREYIGQEIMGGLGRARYLPIVSGFPDYARYIDKVRELEAKYAYNPDKAREVITQEMETLGAEFVDGKWMYNGEQVELIGIIRTEDERLEIGDYVSSQLESLGFAVQRTYKSSAEASPIWMRGNPNDGEWHFYTGGWITTLVSRDMANNFDFYFTPRGLPVPLWQAYTPSPEFDEIADRLQRNDFATMEERGELFRRALELSMEDAVRFWLVDEYSFSPYRTDVTVGADLAGNIQGSWIWPYTLRRVGKVGGSMTVANGSILTDPWNPLAGSNWVYDTMLERGTGERETFSDPFTGLVWPQRIERAEVFIREGLPVAKTLDWVNLEFVPDNEVPEDAWIDWDAAGQRFITVGEAHPEGLTSAAKVVVYFPENLYDIKWHDGSNLSTADFVMRWILTLDLGKEESAVYDEAQVPTVDSFLASFKGWRIASENPLVLEFYTDQYYLDAEWNVSQWTHWWPNYNYGPGSWHMLGIGLLAEANQELAFSADKADALEIDWMSYIAGPSIEILAKYLEQAVNENYIPYEPTLGQYISAEEAQARWTSLQEWYRKRGHFWVGTGPFYLERAFPVEGTVILKRYLDHPDPVGKWDRFGKPMFAEVEIDGPGRVTSGAETAYDLYLTYEGEPYAIEDIEKVKYLVFDATGELALIGEAVAVQDGQWQIMLDAEATTQLAAGSNRLEVAVMSKLVSIPTFESFEFVTSP
jgi:peptide/nickel transport system substrate-binding protein